MMPTNSGLTLPAIMSGWPACPAAPAPFMSARSAATRWLTDLHGDVRSISAGLR